MSHPEFGLVQLLGIAIFKIKIQKSDTIHRACIYTTPPIIEVVGRLWKGEQGVLLKKHFRQHYHNDSILLLHYPCQELSAETVFGTVWRLQATPTSGERSGWYIK